MDSYNVRPLQDRQGFHAFQLTLTWKGSFPLSSKKTVHVVYWVGLEAVDGKIVSNAVRLASEGQQYFSCGQWLDDTSTYYLQVKASLAEATIGVQPRPETVLEQRNDEGHKAPCSWTGLLHWKPGNGFRVRKLAENCGEPSHETTISDDGNIM